MSKATHTIVMTGATRGFGRVAAVKLLRSDPTAHLAVIARAGHDELVAYLQKAVENPHFSITVADLSSMASVRAAARMIGDQVDRGTLPPLSGFIGNAGLQLVRATDYTDDGLEMTFAVNVLANFVLVEELRQHFQTRARIVITTSDTHFGDFRHNQGMVPAPKWREPAALATPGTADKADGAVAGRTAYSTSKLAVIYLVHAYARQLPAGIEIFSFNPGLVPGTGLVRDSGVITRFMFRGLMPAMTLTPYARTRSKSGADLAAAAYGPIDAASGSYINGSKVEPSSAESYDAAREDALWRELTRLSTRQVPLISERPNGGTQGVTR